MSVNIVPTQQPGSWLQRLTGTEPRTVVRESSTTTVSSVAGGSFNLGAALRNGGIGAAVAGALGGVSLLGKVALPLIGKVASLGGLARLAGIGGALGVATAALPLVAPMVQRSPTAKAALVGAGIGAAAGLVLPLVPIWLGAAAGAGVALILHARRNRPASDYPMYPGYDARPGYVPYGTEYSRGVPAGLVPVTPNYGSPAGAAMHPYGVGGNGFGYPGTGYPGAGYPGAGYPGAGYPGAGYPGAGGYGASGYPVAPGYGHQLSLPMQAAAAPQGLVAQPTTAAPAIAAAPAARPGVASGPKNPHAKTFTDGSGNVRQVGSGAVVKASTRAAAPGVGMVPAGTAAPIGYGAAPTAAAGMSQLASPGSYQPGMASLLPFAGVGPSGAPSPMPALPSVQPPAIPVRP